MKRKIITIENDYVQISPDGESWMSVYELAGLFGCFISKINANIRAILKSGVLYEAAVCRTYCDENGSCTDQYNLKMIAALSFRISSHNSEVFRKWLFGKLSKTELPEMLIVSIQNPMLN